MSSIQRVALFILFDSIENDLTNAIRQLPDDISLTDEETAKAKKVLARRREGINSPDDPFDLIHGLDIKQKFDLLLRHKESLPSALSRYLNSQATAFSRIVAVRNAVMHGRPLTIDEYALGFSFADQLLRNANFWPTLSSEYSTYNENPDQLRSRAISFLDEPTQFGVLNNLPSPDYEDTGFLRRPELEEGLKRRILGRYPVITVQGDGGNGKTALTLQTLWNLVESDDHSFDLVLWYSAKTSSLTERGIVDIKSDYVDSLKIIGEVASYGARRETDPFNDLLSLLAETKVLLVVDNLETVTGPYIERLAQDVPGESKIVLTSRVPVSGDLPVIVPEFTEKESLRYIRSLINAHALSSLKTRSDEDLLRYCKRLGLKPLLLKWFALGVKSGGSPDRIVADPENALRFCLDNVLNRLSDLAMKAAQALVAVSESLSPSVIGEITSLSAENVEEGLAVLTRYGLVDFQDLANSERNYRLRPFVRSYILRILAPRREELFQIQRAYQRLQSKFQGRRAAEKFNRYEPKNRVVRTTGEAVADGKLRRLEKALNRENDQEVEDGIAALKISDPGYFEVYRFEAYAAYTWYDIPRSIDAYEAALEYGVNQPQLHFFYGGMLMRAGYADLAATQFDQALGIDPNAAPVLREAARNEMRRARFDKAEAFLCRADANSGLSLKENALIIDLWIQYYQRSIDHLSNNDACSEASIVCAKFLAYLRSVNMKLFDGVIIDHLLKVEPSLRRILGDARVDASSARELRQWINSEIYSNGGLTLQRDRFIGILKPRGRQETYGFLTTRDGQEFFIAAANVAADDWAWLRENGPVEFSVRRKSDGRTEACNVSPVTR